jgi:Protein of unknown function (DUF2510)/zinc-ribbon family
MIIIFGLRRLRKGLGPILLRCSNCGASPLVLLRVSTWFALFFIPVIPVSFKHYTACPNCKRLEQVSKSQVESAREQESAMRAAHQDGTAPVQHGTAPVGIAPVPAHEATLESAVNEWASVGPPQSGSAEPERGQESSQITTAPPPPPPPAGWFPDPAGTGGQRYWDGTQWTEHTSSSS